MSSKLYRKVAMASDMDNHLIQIMYFIVEEKRAIFYFFILLKAHQP